MRNRILAGLIAALSVSACSSEGDDPLSADHKIAARTVQHDLPIARLDSLLGVSGIQGTRSLEGMAPLVVAWTNYQRLAYAASHHDTLAGQLDVAIRPLLDNARISALLGKLRAGTPPEAATAQTYQAAKYNIIAVRSIYFAYPSEATEHQRDSVRGVASRVKVTVSSANFGMMAARYSDDHVSAGRGGSLGVIPGESANSGVVEAVRRMAPGDISEPIATGSGVNIIQRMTWDDARADYQAVFRTAADAEAETKLTEGIASLAELVPNPKSYNTLRDALINPLAAMHDSTTIVATFDRGGKVTLARFLEWASLIEPQRRFTMFRAFPRSGDPVLANFVESVSTRSVLLRSADSAKIEVAPTLRDELREKFKTAIVASWRDLGVSQEQAKDSAAAAAQADLAFNNAVSGKQPVKFLPSTVERALNAKYPAVVSISALKNWLRVE